MLAFFFMGKGSLQCPRSFILWGGSADAPNTKMLGESPALAATVCSPRVSWDGQTGTKKLNIELATAWPHASCHDAVPRTSMWLYSHVMSALHCSMMQGVGQGQGAFASTDCVPRRGSVSEAGNPPGPEREPAQQSTLNMEAVAPACRRLPHTTPPLYLSTCQRGAAQDPALTITHASLPPTSAASVAGSSGGSIRDIAGSAN